MDQEKVKTTDNSDSIKQKKSRTKSMLVVSGAILCSRILGLIRESVLLRVFGTVTLEPFYLAFRIPNLLRDLFAEGALSTAFVTTFSKKIKKYGDKSAFELASKVITLASLFMAFLILICIIIMPIILDFLPLGNTVEDKKELITHLSRIMFPFIGILSISSIVMGILNSKNVFGIPALASSFFNIGSITVGLLLSYYIDPTFGTKALTGMSIGILAGGLFQLCFQLPYLWKIGYRFKPNFNFRDSGVKKILQLMWPAIIAGSVIQVSVIIDSIFATYCEAGSVSWLQAAFRMVQLPLGLFGVAVSMVTLPAISKVANLENIKEFRAILSHGIRFVIFLVLPAAIGLALFSDQIIALIFQGKSFTYSDTILTANALLMYSIGLLFYAIIRVIQPAFYAINKRMIPMIISLSTLIIKSILNYIFIFILFESEPNRHIYLALSTSISAFISCLLLILIMKNRLQGLEMKKNITHFMKLIFPVFIMVLICLVSKKYILNITYFNEISLFQKAIRLLPIISISALSYFATSYLLNVDGVKDLINVFPKKTKIKNNLSF